MLAALTKWRAQRRDPLADDNLLEKFTALNDRLLGVAYRQDPQFQWPHLETWEAHIYGEQEESDR